MDDDLDAARVMVRDQIASRGIRDARVLEAMGAIPRHEFVPERARRDAYADHPLSIGEGQTISQPYIVALMTEAAALAADARVLEVGCGSGYQAAVLARLAAEVHSTEVKRGLAREARERLGRLGFRNVHVHVRDGYHGVPEHAPYGAVLVTCAAREVPPPLVEQLRPGGRLVIPVGEPREVQSLLLVTKREDGSTLRTEICPVRFVPLVGPR